MLKLLNKNKKTEALATQMQVEEVKRWLEQERRNLINQIDEACKEVNEQRASYSLKWLLKIGQLRKVSEFLVSEKERKVPSYIVGSWFLRDSYLYLTRGTVECFHYVTGISFNNVYTLDRIVQVKMDHQTLVSAQVDSISSHKALCKMDEYGYRLLGHFHSHPGRGPRATFPSGIDLSYQERLEQGGYRAVGAIFSQDEYVRFFPENKDFEITVYGKGVKQIDRKLFCLTEISEVRNKGNNS